jgi:hypothetical protein
MMAALGSSRHRVNKPEHKPERGDRQGNEAAGAKTGSGSGHGATCSGLPVLGGSSGNGPQNVWRSGDHRCVTSAQNASGVTTVAAVQRFVTCTPWLCGDLAIPGHKPAALVSQISRVAATGKSDARTGLQLTAPRRISRLPDRCCRFRRQENMDDAGSLRVFDFLKGRRIVDKPIQG